MTTVHSALEGDLRTSLDAGRDAHDRATELYSGTVSERPWGALFTALATSRTFREKVWAKEPFVTEAAAAGTAGSAFVTRSFCIDDVAQYVSQYPSSYAAQGALSPDGKGGWYMKKVGTGQGQDSMMTFADVEESLHKGTVVLNSAGAYLTPLATISLATLESFQMPVGLNVYITAPGMKVSAPPHTDKQDVFVLQTQGSKHWRVYAPPAPSSKMAADPYARGKGPDALSLDELGAPLIETNLAAGQLLYIPAGFPHTTDTLDQASADPSVHLTIGLDTHIWGLDYSTLRELCVTPVPPPLPRPPILSLPPPSPSRLPAPVPPVATAAPWICPHATSVALRGCSEEGACATSRALRRQKQKTLFNIGGTDRDATGLERDVYFALMEPLPLGFLSGGVLGEGGMAEGSRAERGEADLGLVTSHMALELAGRVGGGGGLGAEAGVVGYGSRWRDGVVWCGVVW